MVQRSVVVFLVMMVVFLGCGEDDQEEDDQEIEFLQTPDYIQRLIIQLGHSDSNEALRASRQLVAIGEAAVPELIRVLNRGNRQSRKLALQTLQEIGAIEQEIGAIEAFRPDRGRAVVTGTVPAAGGGIYPNGVLIINFDNGKNIEDGVVTVNGTPATLAGNQATWNVAGLKPGGKAALAIAWKNTDGTAGAASMTVTVELVDRTPPTVKGGTVKNGSKDVDPAPINKFGRIEITFSEVVQKGEAFIRIDGGDALGTQIEWAGDVMVIRLNKGVVLVKGTTYVIRIKGVKDAAGNTMAVAQIIFSTRGKE